MEQTTQKGLVRGIDRWDLVGLTINAMVGAGIFGLPAKVYGLAGAWSLLAYLVCALLVTLIILCFAEVGSRFAETGGPYLYTRVAFGPVIGFEVGWLLWVARLTGYAALCNLLVSYLSYFWPVVAAGWPRGLTITAITIALTAVNVVGVREAAFVNNLFTIVKLTPLVLFVITGLFFLSPQSFAAPAAPKYGDFSTAALLLIFAFSGFEMAVIPAGETRDPRRHIAFALLTAVGVVALFYVMIQVVCIGTLPGLASSERPLVDASSRFLGSAGASIISVGALISVSGTLNPAMLAGPRILFAMAEQGQLPQFLAATHQRFHTPHLAIMLTAAMMLVLTLQGTFMSALTISTVIRLLAYIATCLALLRLRFKKDAPPARFSAPAGTVVAVAATILSLWLLSNSPLHDVYVAALVAGLGLFIFLFTDKSRQANPGGALSQAAIDKFPK
jgi:basic amino acid/polyamine antiporter, APA family